MSRAGRLESVLRDAITCRVFPGAAFAVGRSDGIHLEGAVGFFDYDGARAVEVDTVYDIASLTKVVAATPAIMHLVEQELLDLDRPVQSYLPEFPLQAVTCRHLLAHASGWPAYVEFFKSCHNREQLLEALWRTPVEAPAAQRSVYSDLGFIALGVLIEKVAGVDVARFTREQILAPLQLERTCFNPRDELHRSVAPTEFDPWRGRLLQGEVHDENAALLGGVAGHAGLFSTVGDLARFAQAFLKRGRPLFRGQTVEEFTRRANLTKEPSSRALGWDTPAPGSSSGTRVTTHAYGHTGYTGASMWIDPQLDWFAILLTNRVHPARKGPGIGPVRINFNEAAVEAVGR